MMPWMPKTKTPRPPIVTLTAWALAGEALALAVYSGLSFYSVPLLSALAVTDLFSYTAFVIEGLYLALAVAALLIVIGVLRQERAAWVLALLVQVLLLGSALTLYWNSKPWLNYGLMVYAIAMVVHLNRGSVRQALSRMVLREPRP